MNINKNIFEMYQKNVFLFNDESFNYLSKNILPILTREECLLELFDNESLIIKKFIYFVESRIKEELNTTIKDKENMFFSKFRNKLISYLSKLIAQELNRYNITELYLSETCIGIEGSQIIFLILKFYNKLEYIDLSYSILKDEEYEIILKALENIDNYFSVNFQGVNTSLKILKYIAKLKSNNLKLEILTDGNNHISKMTISDLNLRKIKYKKKNFK